MKRKSPFLFIWNFFYNIVRIFVLFFYFLPLYLPFVRRRANKWNKESDASGELFSANYEAVKKKMTRWATFTKYVTNVKLEIIDKDRLNKSEAIIVANHRSDLDVLVLAYMSLKILDEIPVFIAKHELKNSFLYPVFKLANTYFIQRDKPKESMLNILNAAKFSKSHKRPLVVFPEGTRNDNPDPKDLLEFKQGTFLIAKRYPSTIIPIAISSPVQSKTRRNYFSLFSRNYYDVTIIQKVKPLSYIHRNADIISNNIRDSIIKELSKI